MGISSFKKLKEPLLDQDFSTLRKQLSTNLVNVYIDGSFYMYSGLVYTNIDSTGAYNEQQVAETACNLIISIINRLKNDHELQINKVNVYFDGKKPYSKNLTMAQRREREVNLPDLQNVKSYLVSQLNSENYTISNLIIGEAEHEMFIHRDVNLPSFMLTDDSDLFNIAYEYNKVTAHDNSFICNKSMQHVINLSSLPQYYGNVSKFIFSLLCALKGCDFTCDIITVTMYKTILKEFEKPSCIQTQRIVDILQNRFKTYVSKEHEIQQRLRTLKASVYNETDSATDHLLLTEEEYENSCSSDYEVPKYETIPSLYTMSDVLFTIRMFLLLLNLTKYTRFQWNTDRCSADLSIGKEGIVAQLNAIHWHVNYNLIGCRYEDYFKDIQRPLRLNSYKFYYAVLECNAENLEGFIDELEELDLKVLKRKEFLNYLKHEYKRQ